jgi:hypothetical protein
MVQTLRSKDMNIFFSFITPLPQPTKIRPKYLQLIQVAKPKAFWLKLALSQLEMEKYHGSLERYIYIHIYM